jgi:hypothetical protein
MRDPVAGHRLYQQRIQCSGDIVAAVGVRAQRGEEGAFHRRSQSKQLRLPLPQWIDAVEASIMQLVARVEGQCQSLAIWVDQGCRFT